MDAPGKVKNERRKENYLTLTPMTNAY